mmetsp:Transcript_13369/g.35945  ORF Transcript_13369/g.35945 Transcript_13369/m.35945 type:complete len:81 (-) Transcript_13369:1772-2014(-)
MTIPLHRIATTSCWLRSSAPTERSHAQRSEGGLATGRAQNLSHRSPPLAPDERFALELRVKASVERGANVRGCTLNQKDA